MEYLIIGFLIGQNIVMTLVFSVAYFSLRNKVDAEVALLWTRVNGLSRHDKTIVVDQDFMTAYYETYMEGLLNNVETQTSDSGNQ